MDIWAPGVTRAPQDDHQSGQYCASPVNSQQPLGKKSSHTDFTWGHQWSTGLLCWALPGFVLFGDKKQGTLSACPLPSIYSPREGVHSKARLGFQPACSPPQPSAASRQHKPSAAMDYDLFLPSGPCRPMPCAVLRNHRAFSYPPPTNTHTRSCLGGKASCGVHHSEPTLQS